MQNKVTIFINLNFLILGYTWENNASDLADMGCKNEIASMGIQETPSSERNVTASLDTDDDTINPTFDRLDSRVQLGK